VGDGWWLEAYSGANGWLIGDDRTSHDDAVQDESDAESLYRLLEEDVVPRFFRRDAHGAPREWLDLVRRSLATIPPVFDSARMVGEYRDLAYAPLAARFQELHADGRVRLRAETATAARLAAGVVSASICAVRVDESATVGIASQLHVDVELGALGPDDVAVEFVVGRRSGAELAGVTVVPLSPEPGTPGVARRFSGAFTPTDPGALGYFVRVRPRGPVSLHDPAIWA